VPLAVVEPLEHQALVEHQEVLVEAELVVRVEVAELRVPQDLAEHLEVQGPVERQVLLELVE